MQNRSSLRRIFAPLGIAFVVLFVLFAVVTWVPLRRARSEFRAGRNAQVIADATSWSRARMWPNQYHQILAIAHASSGHRDAARPHLDAIRGKTLLVSLVPKEEVARGLFAQHRYDWFLDYDAAVRERGESSDTPLYRAAAYAMNKETVPRAVEALRTIDRTKVDAKKLAALEASIAQRSTGAYPYVVDRNGKPIAEYHLNPDEVIPANKDFAGFVSGEGGRLTIAANKERLGSEETIETTLDSDVQRAAKAAIANYRGAIVVIDPRSNEILAIVSNDPKGRIENIALEEQYEPGSIIKVLTGLNALSIGVDMNSMFPYHCSGDLEIDGRHFGDWLPQGHGTLPELDDALAESCNVFFADVGVRLGVDRLRKFMTASGFDGQTDLQLFQAPLGRITGDIFNKFETAFVAIGLEHESATALHVAMIASMMANRGVLTAPTLLRARRSILGEEFPARAKHAQARIAPREAAERMVQAMVAVVTKAKGTGRRADIEGVSLALKTGTAGKRERGYQAVIMAFAPVQSPKIAFGIIAENSGPAEFAGAKIAHDLLAGVEPRLK